MRLIKLFDKKEKKEMIIEETLPDVQQIKVPDLKHLNRIHLSACFLN